MRHDPVLDGLRALAVLIVIVSHAGLGSIVPGGIGVTIFFFLSGYLIASLMRVEMETKQSVSLKLFYMRRFLRIFPPFYLTMAVVLALIVSGALSSPVGAHAVWIDGLFLTNYSHIWTTQTGLPMPLWSLDVEEHFYLLFPALFIFLTGSFRPAAVAAILAGLCTMVLSIRLFNAATLPDISQNYYWSHTRVDSILFGACLAVWNNPALDKDAWRPKAWHGAVAIAALLATLVIRDTVFRETLRYTVQGIALFVLFAFLLHERGWIRQLLSCWPLKWIGLLSYTLYLCHVPALLLVKQSAPGLGALGIGLAGILLSLAYAIAMYWIVEKPMAGWRKSLHKPA